MVANQILGLQQAVGAEPQASLQERKLRRKARLLANRMAAEFGSPDHGNLTDPLDELIYILLSQMTTHHSYRRVFQRLKSICPAWQDVLALPTSRLQEIIADAGLSRQKAGRIKTILERITHDFDETSLSRLKTMSDDAAQDYLVSLPGVGTKTAKCVLMYALDRRVLPVDTHVARVARRTGLLTMKVPQSRIHSKIEAVVPLGSRFTFHVNAIALGRSYCLAKRPRCPMCPVRTLCDYYRPKR